jgi:type IV pilus biogenesis protein CpaD/CtpE
MNRKDIIHLAIEHTIHGLKFDEDGLIRFAALVASAEREACAKVAEDMSKTEANMNKTWRNGCHDVANEIRARGQA